MSKRLFRLGPLVVACLLAAGCAHDPLPHPIQKAEYHFDNALPFQPNRIWRLKVRWEPYLLDDKRALIIKEFQYVLHGDFDRRRLEAEVNVYGGDNRYLRWFESELFPLGNWEERVDARIVRYSDMTVVVLTTKSLKEIKRGEMLTLSPVFFPDPLLRGVTDSCHQLNWDVIPKGDSVGLEVMLFSRELEPEAYHWERRDFDSSSFWWRQWSVGQEHSIAYRTVMFFKNNVARCPLPPHIFDEFKKIKAGQRMGVEW